MDILNATRHFEFVLTGVAPMIMHQDNLEFQEAIAAWRKDPENKKYSVPGDDRSPAWTWIGCPYHDGERCGVSQDNVMTCLRNAGAKILVPTGKHGQTFKGMTQLIIIDQILLPVTVDGNPVPWKPIEKLIGVMDFEKHKEVAEKLGFKLFVKRAPVNKNAKHIRVRPKFNTWTVTGSFMVSEDLLTTEVLKQIFTYAGNYIGLCDWRPGAKTPGPFGRFTSELKQV